MDLKLFHRRVLLAAALAYAATAWNSTGFHGADEHFQIIEFAQWKLGELPAAHLVWEFNAGIRPSFQPWVAAAVFKAASFMGTHDPFTRAFLLRALTALLALAAVHRFVGVAMERYDDPSRKAFILLAYGLWFIPFLSVRFSSEGWSAIFLLQAVTSVLSSARTRHWALHAGFFAGLAIVCRPPTGAIVLSLVAWSLLVRREPWKNMVILPGTAAVIVLGGLLLDAAFYGQATPTTWNYLKLGFTGDPPLRFDELPWYYYPPWIVKYAIPPIGAIMLAALAVLLIKHPKHPVVWCMLPYVIVHSFIPHKELRFLYPLALLVPWMLLEVWRTITPWMARIPRTVLRITAAIPITANALGLAVVLTSPAGEGQVRLAEALHGTARPGDTIAYAVNAASAWRITLPAFYRPPGTHTEIVQPDAWPARPEQPAFLVVQDGMPLPMADERSTLIPVARTETDWCALLMRGYTWGEGRKPWTLYRVEH